MNKNEMSAPGFSSIQSVVNFLFAALSCCLDCQHDDDDVDGGEK